MVQYRMKQMARCLERERRRRTIGVQFIRSEPSDDVRSTYGNFVIYSVHDRR